MLGGGVTALWLAITEPDNDSNSGSSWAYATMTVKAPGPAGHCHNVRYHRLACVLAGECPINDSLIAGGHRCYEH